MDDIVAGWDVMTSYWLVMMILMMLEKEYRDGDVLVACWSDELMRSCSVARGLFCLLVWMQGKKGLGWVELRFCWVCGSERGAGALCQPSL